MEEEVKGLLDQFEGQIQAASQIALEKQMKSEFLNGASTKEGTLWGQLKLITGSSFGLRSGRPFHSDD
jgi:hypothetical protein